MGFEMGADFEVVRFGVIGGAGEVFLDDREV